MLDLDLPLHLEHKGKPYTADYFVMNFISPGYFIHLSGLEILSRQSRDVGDSGVLTTRLTACTAPPPASGTVTVLPGELLYLPYKQILPYSH